LTAVLRAGAARAARAHRTGRSAAARPGPATRAARIAARRAAGAGRRPGASRGPGGRRAAGAGAARDIGRVARPALLLGFGCRARRRIAAARGRGAIRARLRRSPGRRAAASFRPCVLR